MRVLRLVQTIEHVPRQQGTRCLLVWTKRKTCTAAETIAAVLPHNEPFFVDFFHELKGIPCRSVDDILTDYFDWEKKRG